MLQLFPYLGYNKDSFSYTKKRICEGRYSMTITVTYEGFILTVLAVLGMVLLVYLILLFRKLIGTLRQVDEILSDAKVVSGIASDKAQLVDGIIDDAGEAVGSITDAIRGNQSIVAAASSLVNTFSSVIGLLRRKAEKEEDKKELSKKKTSARKEND